MIVLDASAVLELLLGTPRGQAVGAALRDPAVALHAPHLLDVEVAQVLRRLVASAAVRRGEAASALADLRALDLERHGHELLLDRVWALRANLSAYDAVYVALAEALGGELLTCDARLGRAPGVRARVRVVA